MKSHPIDRMFLLLTGVIAAYQVASGINGLDEIPIIAYTIAFGVVLLASLLLIILGMDILDSPIVVIVSTIIPLSMSLGLIWQYLPNMRIGYLGFAITGLIAVILSRSVTQNRKLQTIVLALVHAVAGLIIFLLPSILAARGICSPVFALVGLGGAFISLGGMLLSFLKTGKPLVSRDMIFRILPILLLIMTVTFVIGFAVV